MSENPFLSPQSDQTTCHHSPSVTKAPVPLTVILIFCTAFGLGGTLGSCGGVVGSFFNIMIINSSPRGTNNSADKFAQEIQEAGKASLIPNLILMIANFFIAPMMAAGAFGCFLRKKWGHRVLRLSLVAATGFVLIRLIVGTFVQFRMKSAFVDGFANNMGKSGPDPRMVASLVEGFFWFGIVAGLLWVITQAGFYVWSWTYLNKEEVRTYLNVQTNSK